MLFLPKQCAKVLDARAKTRDIIGTLGENRIELVHVHIHGRARFVDAR